jgi:MoaA/NifB/PqqE/SkfB family radical SAM enzyme
MGGVVKYFVYKRRNRPILMNIEVTKRCNARCDFCDYWTSKRIDEMDDYLPIVRMVRPIVTSFTGGEPLMRKDLAQLIRRIRDNTRYNYLCVITNGVLLDEKRASELWEAGVDQLSISLDFLGEEHDRMRGVPGLYSHLSSIIPRLRSVGFDNVQLNTVIMEDNLDQIPAIARQAYDWGVRVAFSSYAAVKTNNGSHTVGNGNLRKLNAVIAELIGMKRSLGNIITSDYYLKHVPVFFEHGAVEGCLAGRRWIQVTPDGYMKPCSEKPAFCHYTEYTGTMPETKCQCCWFNCRGESQAPLDLQRILELVRSRKSSCGTREA